MSVDLGTDLDQLVDLSSHPTCEWPQEQGGCTNPAVVFMVQRHTRPPLACLRLPLCQEHREVTQASERAWLAARGPGAVVCTPHHRRVDMLARWEPM